MKYAICPKCEKKTPRSDRTVEAWCQHAYGYEFGQITPVDQNDVLEKVPCKIIEVEDKK